MEETVATRLKPNILCVIPPYLSVGAPPLGPAALLAYLKANGCDDFSFLDLRLWTSNSYSPTYRPTGVFGETYVVDIPDLPLVLSVINNFENGLNLLPEYNETFESYCLERGISSTALYLYLKSLDRFFNWTFSQIGHIDFIGFTVWSSNLLTTLLAAAHLKRRANPPLITFGGPQVTESQASAKLSLRSGLADVVALGEGEETLLRLFEDFRTKRGVPSGIPGTMCRSHAGVGFDRIEGSLLRLSKLPVPAFDQMPLLSYQLKGRERSVTYELSRGCTDKCTFCSQWVFWKRMRINEVDVAIDGVQELLRRYKAERIWFMDSLLNASLNRLNQFADEVLRLNIKFKWGGFMRANVDKDTAALLAAAGCDFAFVGVESLSDETLQLMKKRRTEADNFNALTALLNAGFRKVIAGFIPGFPGDTRSRFFRTALALRDVYLRYPNSFRVNIEPFFIAPGQPMYNQLESFGLQSHKWSDNYLNIAPQYRDITDEIYCTVEGSNQGLERLGELAIAQVVAEGVSEDEEEDLLYYNDPQELSGEQLEILTLQHSYLGRFKAEDAKIRGFILSAEERNEYEAIRRASRILYVDGFPEPLMKKEKLASFLHDVEGKHVLTSNSGNSRVLQNYYIAELTEETKFVASSGIIGRNIEVNGETLLLLVNLITIEEHYVDPTIGCLLAHLLREPVSARNLSELMGKTFSGRSLELP